MNPNWISCPNPNFQIYHTWDIPGSPVLYPYCTCLVAQSLLKNFLAALQGAWRFTLWRWETRQLEELWFYSASCLVRVTACLGSALLPQFSSAEVEGSSGNALCELHDLPGHCLREGGESPIAKFLGRFRETGQWRNEESVCWWLGLRLFWGGVETRDE